MAGDGSWPHPLKTSGRRTRGGIRGALRRQKRDARRRWGDAAEPQPGAQGSARAPAQHGLRGQRPGPAAGAREARHPLSAPGRAEARGFPRTLPPRARCLPQTTLPPWPAVGGDVFVALICISERERSGSPAGVELFPNPAIFGAIQPGAKGTPSWRGGSGGKNLGLRVPALSAEAVRQK